MGCRKVGFLLVVIMLLHVTDVAGRRGGGSRGGSYYRYRTSYYSGTSGGASPFSLTSGAIIGVITGIVGVGICMRYLPLREYTIT